MALTNDSSLKPPEGGIHSANYHSEISLKNCARSTALRGVVALVCLAILCGCSNSVGKGSNDGSSSAETASLTVNCTPAIIFTNQTSACVATLQGAGTSGASPVWSIVDTTMGSVSQSGLFTPARAGTVIIYAGLDRTGLVGSATITVKDPPPSNLTYSKSKIMVSVGEFTYVQPSVVGVVDQFSISPQLPEGLLLFDPLHGRCGTEDDRYTRSGTICGTPKVASPETVYTVTASNSSGSTSTTLTISVRIGAPSSFAYPLSTINATVGQAIPSDVPSVAGAVDLFSVSPELPPGLVLDASTGTISGVPAAVTPQADYVVTATNANGSSDATVTISVAQQQIVLELGHEQPISTLRMGNDRVLSADTSAHWALWDYSSGALLANGDGMRPFNNCVIHYMGEHCPYPVPSRFLQAADMAGQNFVIAVSNGLEVHAQSDGHLISSVVFRGLNQFGLEPLSPDFYSQMTNWWQLASDGSYISIGSQTGLYVFTPQATLLFSKAGDYSKALSNSAPDRLYVALGPAGANVIESISIPDGTSTNSSSFTGAFNSWFGDGSRFLSSSGNRVFVYSKTGTQEAAVDLPSIVGLGGQGSWIWTFDRGRLEIYPVGSQTSALSWNGEGDRYIKSGVTLSAQTLGFVSYSYAANTGSVEKFNVVDLSGLSPVESSYSFPVEYGSSYAATSSSQWIAGNGNGVILDGASLSSSPRYFGYGDAWSIAGTVSRAAISTANGKILVIDPNSQTIERQIDLSAGKIAISDDGSLLGAATYFGISGSSGFLDRTLTFYSLPSGAVTSTFPYSLNSSSPVLFDFTLSASGTMMGRATGTFQQSSTGSSWLFARQVSHIDGSTIWSDNPSPYNNDAYYLTPPFLSPDGSLIAATLGPRKSQTSITSILKDSVGGIGNVPGYAVGWIDNNRFLANIYSMDVNGILHYASCSIYSATGEVLASPPLPELASLQPVGRDTIYDPSRNAIYSLTTGQPVWMASFTNLYTRLNPLTNKGVGAVAGNYVVYKSGPRVVAEPF